VACAFLWAWWARSRISPAKLPQAPLCLWCHAFIDSLFELGDLFFGAGTVAGHAAVSESPVDGISPRFNGVIGRQIEVESLHGFDIRVVAKQWANILGNAHCHPITSPDRADTASARPQALDVLPMFPFLSIAARGFGPCGPRAIPLHLRREKEGSLAARGYEIERHQCPDAVSTSDIEQ